MALMWASFVLLTLVALLFVVVPFFKRERIQRLDHNANSELIRIYHQRLDELKTDLDNQRIDAQMHDESVIEQKRRLLNELSPEKALNSKGNNRIFALTGAGFLIVLTAFKSQVLFCLSQYPKSILSFKFFGLLFKLL